MSLGELTEASTGAYVTTSEAARLLGLSESRTRQLADRGSLVAVLTPLGRLISRESVDSLIRHRERER